MASEVGPGARRHWMSVLAKARPAEIEAAWDRLGAEVAHEWLRRPEAGMAMVRGRAGGSGQPFCLGEMTMTRCAVRLADGQVGFGYVAGRSMRHAELAALCDALLQAPSWRDRVMAAVIAPLQDAGRARREERARKTAATRVDFFTMVRGEDPQ